MSVDNTPTGIVYTVTNGNAGQQYPLTFPYIKSGDVRAYCVHNGTQMPMAQGSGYAVTGQMFTANIALPVGAKLAIYRQTDITQEILWVDGQAVYTPDIMQADDKQTYILQEIAGDVARSVKVSREELAGGAKPENLKNDLYSARDAAVASAAASSSSAASAAGSAGQAAGSTALATAEANRAKTEADRATDIANVGPATAAKLGFIKVGTGLSINADGLLSAPPAAGVARGIGRIATLADLAPGATIANGPAFLSAGGGIVRPDPAAYAIPQAGEHSLISRYWLPDAYEGYKGAVKLAAHAANSGADVVQAGAFTAGFTTVAGWQRLQGGLILQFGAVSVPHATNTNVTFPLAFPNSCSFATFSLSATTGGPTGPFCVSHVSKTVMTLYQPTGVAQTCYWLALGY